LASRSLSKLSDRVANKILAVADAEVGIHEDGFTNRGKRVDEYAKAGNAGLGVAWCMNFVAWVRAKAGYPLPIKTSSVWALLQDAKARGYVVTRPFRGDLITFAFKSSTPIDHVGFVYRVIVAFGPILTLRTIEGNTSPEGVAGSQENGGNVARRIRIVKRSKVAFLRYP